MRIIVAGCGHVGILAARQLAQMAWEVVGLTRSPESAAALDKEPFPVIPCDISDAAAVTNFADDMGREPAVILHAASSGKGDATAYSRVFLDGCRNLVGILRPLRFVFCSSTSVYAQTDGDWVTESSPAIPSRDTGVVLRKAEEFVLENGGIVARLAGLYGPGRSVILRRFFEGTAVIEGDGRRWVNQLHAADAARALALLAENGNPGIYNVADDRPSPQFELYDWLSARFRKPRPPFGPVDVNRKRGVTNKCVSNARLRSLGWTPRYPSFYDAVEHDSELVRQAQEPSAKI